MEEDAPSALYRCTFGRHLEVEEVPREGVLSGTWTTLICHRRYICISADLCCLWTSCPAPHLDLLAPLPVIILTLLRRLPYSCCDRNEAYYYNEKVSAIFGFGSQVAPHMTQSTSPKRLEQRTNKSLVPRVTTGVAKFILIFGFFVSLVIAFNIFRHAVLQAYAVAWLSRERW